MGLLEYMMNQYYQTKLKNDTRPMRKLHPSTIGMCQRRIVFDMMMVPVNRIEDRMVRVFENGHSMHHRYETLFQEMGILVQAEMKIEAEGISGHTDALIRIHSFAMPEGELYLVELKSAMSDSFKWMKEKNQPKKEHVAQLQFYMHLSGIHKGIIFVECKNTQEVLEFMIEYDPQLGQELYQKAVWCIQMAKERKLPSIPKYHTPSSYKCSICSYNFYCHYGNTTNQGVERFPIPFKFGSELYYDVLRIITAIQQGETIPEIIEGDTNGALRREVEMKNHRQPQERV